MGTTLEGRLKDPRGYRHDGLRVAESRGKGLGVFAARPFKKGSLIELAPVIVVPQADEDVFQITFLKNYTFGVGDRVVIGLGFSSLYNHSFTPNADYLATAKGVVFKALRPIKAGEEITIDYNWRLEDYEECQIHVPQEVRSQLEESD